MPSMPSRRPPKPRLLKAGPGEGFSRPGFASGSFEDAELGQRGDTVVETDLLGDLAVLDPEHRGAGEVRLAARPRRQRAGEKIAKRRPGMRAAAFPAADDIIALGDEIGSAPEVEVGEGRAEPQHEVPYVLAAAAWRVQRILQQHIGGGELVDDPGVPGIGPETSEPAADNGLVFAFA